MTPHPGHGEGGFGLPSVLLLVTLLSLLVGGVLLVDLAGRRTAALRADRLQARYAAEAALDRTLGEIDPLRLPSTFDVSLGARAGARAVAEPFGPFVLVTSDGRTGRARHRVRALVGASPGPDLPYAVVLGDPTTPLVLAGDAVVNGAVLTGPPGVQFGALPGRPAAPLHAGGVVTADTPTSRTSLPAATATAAAFESILTGGRSPGDSAFVIASSGDLSLSAADLAEVGGRDVWAVAGGDLTVAGPLVLPPYVRLAAAGTVRLVGDVGGGPALAYGRTGAETAGPVTASVHLLAGRSVRVGSGATLRFPSSAVAVAPGGVTVEVDTGAALDGFAAYAPSIDGRTAPDGLVAVRRGARLRGALYSADRAEVEGEVVGPTVTWQFRFYESPSTYVNWLRSGRYHAHVLPPPAVPYGAGAPGPGAALDVRSAPLPDVWTDTSGRDGTGLHADRGGRLPRAPRRRPRPARDRVLVGRLARRRSGPDGRARARSGDRRGRSLRPTWIPAADASPLARRHRDGARRATPHRPCPGVEKLRWCPLDPPRRRPGGSGARRAVGGSEAVRDEAGFTLVELSVGVSLALLVTALALGVFGVLGRQAAAWRAGTELALTADVVLATVSTDLSDADAPPERQNGMDTWPRGGPPAQRVSYQLTHKTLERNGRPMHGASIETEAFRVTPGPPPCVEVRFTLSTLTWPSRHIDVETMVCSRAPSPWPPHP